MTSATSLIDLLRARQRDAGESDLRFAQRLGISRQMWGFLRTGERQPGPDTLQAIGRAYPDLMPQIVAFHTSLLFVPQNATNVTESSAGVAIREEVQPIA